MNIVKKIIKEIRWLLVPLYFGLGLSMVAFVVKFFQELYHILSKIVVATETQLLLEVLHLIDIVMVANLLVMVIISGYETFIGPIKSKGEFDETPGWLSKLDPGTVKIKLAASVAGISLVKLLAIYLKPEDFSSERIMWSVIMHITFLLSALILAFVDRLSYGGKED